MEQIRDYSDERLRGGCVFCHGPEETRDHVPSRVFLDSPLPSNLPVVPSCWKCNNGFSPDEEYLACLVEIAAVGSTDPGMMRREKVAKILTRSPRLRAQIDGGRSGEEGEVRFFVETDRVRTVVLKLAKGHAAFELGRPFRQAPSQIAWWVMHLMTERDRCAFDAPYFPENYGEVGARGLQRMQVVEMSLESANGDRRRVGFLMNDWVEVQEERYRYQAIETHEEVIIRMVIGGYLGASVVWTSLDSVADSAR